MESRMAGSPIDRKGDGKGDRKSNTCFIFYKNHVYKNVEAKISENLRTC